MDDPIRDQRVSIRGLATVFGLAVRAGPQLLVPYGLAVVSQAAIPVTVAWLTKLALDRVAGGGSLTGVIVGFAVTALVAAVLPACERFLKNELERRIALLAQDRLFEVVERFVGIKRFEDPHFLDRLSLAHQSGGMTPGLVVSGVLAVARGLVTVTGFIGALMAVSRWLAVAVLAAAIPALLAEWQLSRKRAALMWRIGPLERREIFYRLLLTSVEAAKEIRLFGTGSYFRHRMSAERRSADAERRGMDVRELAVQVALGFISAAVTVACLGWTLLAAGQGRVTVGDVALLAGAVAGVQATVVLLINELMMAHQQLLAFSHYLAVTRSVPDLVVAAQPLKAGPLRTGIEFRGVWFRYSPDHPWALKDLSFTIPAGMSVALIGRNGAGKSTLVKLLCRLYDPDRGTILWDGIDVRDLDPASLRRRIGTVFQDYMQYDLTAAENIGIGDLGSDRQAIERAAARAGVHERLASLPSGYDTPLTRIFFGLSDGDGDGVVLSGGQWQRLALARALLRDQADLLVLDEPSSGLDAVAEVEIHTALRTHRSGLTSLLISHRLSAVRDADLLIVLEEGEVVERGDHSSLLAAKGVYARLFTLQANGYQDSSS